MTSNITLTDGTNTVEIFTEKVEEVIEKKLDLINIPRSTQKRALGSKTKIIDLLVVTHSFIITGQVSAYSSDTAQQQRVKLKSMIDAGGTVTMNYTGANYTVNFKKVALTQSSSDSDTASKYTLMTTLIVGEDR